jgi:hypothetical protein
MKTQKQIPNTSQLTGVSFKVHNTWGFQNIWNEGGKELMINKILATLKKVIKDRIDIGRVSKMYVEQGEHDGQTFSILYYETKDFKVSVKLNQGLNLNGGTWYKISEIKFV